jgi:hypothetical protein
MAQRLGMEILSILVLATFAAMMVFMPHVEALPIDGGKLAVTPRVSSDTPSFAAFTPVAPGVRFNALAIFLTPIFCFASDFNSRTSFLVHSRLTTFFFAILAMSAPVVEPRLLTHQISIATRSPSSFIWLAREQLLGVARRWLNDLET